MLIKSTVITVTAFNSTETRLNHSKQIANQN